jgi:hypothetical protein
MYAITTSDGKELPLCLDCYSKYAVIQQNELESHERWMNYLQDEMASASGFRIGPRFPPRPRPVHISGTKMTNINVSNSVVGTINTGSIGSVDQSISALIQTGEPALANAIKQLSEAIISSGDLTSNQKNELVESLSVIAGEAATPKNRQRKTVANALLDRAIQMASTANDITDVCQKWWPVLQSAFS